jgi:hypothetical protein
MEEQVNIREMLIERIRDLRKLKHATVSRRALEQLEDLELLNIKIYYVLFGSKI